MLKPGDVAPAFKLPCAVNDRLTSFSLSEASSPLAVVFFYPRDFSFICPTEVFGFHRAQAEFSAQGAQLLGLGVDSAESHLRWARELGGISYPLLSDQGGAVTREFGVFDEREQAALRATFILDQQRVVVYALASRSNVGRSVSETRRVVSALRTGRQCPADRKPGQEFGPADKNF
jgi:peroxiredoxin 2/4